MSSLLFSYSDSVPSGMITESMITESMIPKLVPFYCMNNEEEVYNCVKNVLYCLDDVVSSPRKPDAKENILPYIFDILKPRNTITCYFNWSEEKYKDLTTVYEGQDKIEFIKYFMLHHKTHLIYICEKSKRSYIIRGYSANHIFVVSLFQSKNTIPGIREFRMPISSIYKCAFVMCY
jgi:hypothetical protein